MDDDTVRLAYLRLITYNLFKLDPRTADESYLGAKKVLEDCGAACSLTADFKIDVDIGLVEPRDYQRAFLALMTPFESKYGHGKFWDLLRKVTLPFYAAHRDVIIRGRVDLPLMNFGVKCQIQSQSSLSPLASRLTESDAIEWTDSTITIKTQGLLVSSKGQLTDIPLTSLITVGREVYWKSNTEKALKAIDFRHDGSMTTMLLFGQPSVTAELIRVLEYMKREINRLTPLERKMLIHLANLKSIEDLLANLDRDTAEARVSLNRLKELEFIDDFNLITPSGLQALRAQQYGAY